MFAFPPTASPRHKTVIEKILADPASFIYFAVAVPRGDALFVHELYISDGRIWWDAKDPTSRITATVASPYKTYGRGTGPLLCGQLAALPSCLLFVPEVQPFIRAVMDERTTLTQKD